MFHIQETYINQNYKLKDFRNYNLVKKFLKMNGNKVQIKTYRLQFFIVTTIFVPKLIKTESFLDFSIYIHTYTHTHSLYSARFDT